MQIAMAYIGVILIWSTTPLAMKWSTEDVGFLFGLISRMGIATAIAVLFCCMLNKRPPLDARALKTYAATGSSTYLAMMSSYWGVQYIPSGWVSVIFGLSPIFTSIIASRYLGERTVGLVKTGSLLISLAGLWIMFRLSLGTGTTEFHGIAMVVAGVLFHSLGIVAVKQIKADITPLATLTGTLIVSLLLFLATWVIGDYETPATIPIRAAGAILYLGIVGSVLGFLLFFYVLQQVDATRASLITLITPGNALLLGHLLNNEPLTWNIILGTGMIVGGLLLFQYDRQLSQTVIKLFRRAWSNKPVTIYKTE